MYHHFHSKSFFLNLNSLLQKLLKGVTPDIKSNRCKLASKASDLYMMNESSARLVKNQGSFLSPPATPALNK